jgi:hypothetical protein
MLVSVRVIPVYPGLGLKLGSRRGIATGLISGEGRLSPARGSCWGGPNMASRQSCRDAFLCSGASQHVVTVEILLSGGKRCYANILAAVLVYAVSQLRSSSVKGSVDFRVA